MAENLVIDNKEFNKLDDSAKYLYYKLCGISKDGTFLYNPEDALRKAETNMHDFKVLMFGRYISEYQGFLILSKNMKLVKALKTHEYSYEDFQSDMEKCKINLETWDDDGNPIEQKEKEKKYVPSKEVIEYLNKKAGTHFKHNTKSYVENISGRTNEGYTLEDFYKVIDKKCDDWIGTKFQEYLRPQTLFGTKFDTYLNQKVRPRNTGLKTGSDGSDLDGIFT